MNERSETSHSIRLLEIDPTGSVVLQVPLDEVSQAVCQRTAELYRKTGFVPPWVGYLAERDGNFVGTCAFKAPPQDGRVEIAYFTYHPYEGQGVGTAMAQALVNLARAAEPDITVFAKTVPAESGSTTILRRLGFELQGTFQHPEDGAIWGWELPPAATSD